MSLLQGAWFIARKDVAYLLRRRETILWTFVMPIVFFYFIGTVTGGFGPTRRSAHERSRCAAARTAGS